jgi:hypothetical protein
VPNRHMRPREDGVTRKGSVFLNSPLGDNSYLAMDLNFWELPGFGLVLEGYISLLINHG